MFVYLLLFRFLLILNLPFQDNYSANKSVNSANQPSRHRRGGTRGSYGELDVEVSDRDSPLTVEKRLIGAKKDPDQEAHSSLQLIPP